MKIIVPDNYKLIIKVFQFKDMCFTFRQCPVGNQANIISCFLKINIADFKRGELKKPTVILTECEMHILRLLRHVREEVDGIKLNPSNLEVWFDSPDSYDMVICRVTEDGDFLEQVPGGFFTQRAAELF